MTRRVRITMQRALGGLIGLPVALLLAFVPATHAITPIPTPSPEPGSFGLEATKTQPPPTQGATISTPGNGAAFTTSPMTVSGICPSNLLVEVYDNQVMVGSAMCKNGSYSIQVTLFSGANDLTVGDYDDLGQAGPASTSTSVTYNNANFTAFGKLITLTSNYGRRSSAAGAQLSWPLELSGGIGPYALSIDWGDGTSSQLKSQSLPGNVTIAHAFNLAGIYETNVRVTDTDGVSAFLQVVSVADGKAPTGTTNPSNSSSNNSQLVILWLPTTIAIVLLIPAYLLGRRSQVISLRHKMERERDAYRDS